MKNVPTAVAEFAVEERDRLLGRIERLERAYNEWHNKTEWVQDEFSAGIIDASALGLHRADVITRLVAGLRNELSTLKAKSSGVPDKRCQCCGYLVTESEHRGCLRSADVSLPSSVVLPAAFSRAFITGESGDAGYRVVIKSETLEEMQQVHNWLGRLNSSPVSAVVSDERAAFEAWIVSVEGLRFKSRFDRVTAGPFSDDYRDGQVQGAWNVWQARAALSAGSQKE